MSPKLFVHNPQVCVSYTQKNAPQQSCVYWYSVPKTSGYIQRLTSPIQTFQVFDRIGLK